MALILADKGLAAVIESSANICDICGSKNLISRQPLDCHQDRAGRLGVDRGWHAFLQIGREVRVLSFANKNHENP
jgi:hypothetical protein